MVKSKDRHFVKRHPARLESAQIRQRPVYAYKGHISHRDNPVYPEFFSPLQPMHIFRVFSSILRTECLELKQRNLLQTSQFLQDARGSLIKILVFIYQTSGKFHVVENLSVFLSHSFDEQNAHPLAIKPQDHTIHRNVIVSHRT